MKIVPYKRVLDLQNHLVRIATGQEVIDNNDFYTQLRSELIKNEAIYKLLPKFISRCRDLHDFWYFIKDSCNTYAERRKYLREEFEPLLAYLESVRPGIIDDVINLTVKKFDCDTVQYLWGKALARRDADPEGAITAARSLLESVCKQILVERDITYDNSYDLPKLYKVTSRNLNLAPQLHNQNILKQILSGMQTTVNGFASLRNELSDAHGQPKGSYRAGKRHAELAVNFAGSTASFLIQTHQETQFKS